jgi:L-rhamnono-1,4-lactonase
MTLVASCQDVTAHPTFRRWLAGITSLSHCANTYMKLSGCLSELPPGFASTAGADPAAAAGTVFAAVRPWLAAVLAAFGPARVMFGSDWPVCTLGVRGGACAAAEDGGEGETGAVAWELWRQVVERMCDAADLDGEERAMVWGGTAMGAYGIEEPAAD